MVAVGGGEVFAVDAVRRIIRGRAVPFGVVGSKAGMKFQFAPGAVTWGDPKRVKLYLHHDPTTAVGHMLSLVETPDGIDYEARVARTPEGDRALMLADPDGDAVLDGASIGGDPERVKYRLHEGVHHAVTFPLREISLTPQPVFDDARTTSVAMSTTTTTTTTTKDHSMKCTKCGAPTHVGPCDPTTLAAFEAASTTPPATTDQPGTDFSGLTEAIGAAIGDAFTNITFPQREVIDPAHATFEVNEPTPYRFDGIAGKESFSNDLRFYNSDIEAKQRIDAFMTEAWEGQFAVTAGNVSSLNPTRNRPDLYVPNLTFTRPLWDLVTTGVVDDKTPFTIPKFASASGLVGAHTEGVEPTPGAFTATSQTVTPTPMSGKVEIVREVWDQGGEPKADQIIWGEMLNGYFEAIEAKIATTLAAVATAEINLASAVGSALVNLLTGTLVDLQFVRGGNRFTALALDGMLGKALVQATDGNTRPLLPVIGATNAQGTTEPGFDGVAIGNLRGRFAWALGSTNASKSYLFVPSSVYAWASAPKKFEFEYRVSAVDLAIWGYSAAAVTRDSDVKPIDYTTADV
jgi:Caudovirus prohead protease.